MLIVDSYGRQNRDPTRRIARFCDVTPPFRASSSTESFFSGIGVLAVEDRCNRWDRMIRPSSVIPVVGEWATGLLSIWANFFF